METHVQTARIGILTLSDRASQGIYQDLSGPAIEACLKEFISSPWEAIYRVIPDDMVTIQTQLIHLADTEGCALIVTTGGTGPALRDVTPEATEAVCNRMLPGFGELMRSVSLQSVPTAILSRQTAGTRGSCLILNLPGKPESIRTCLQAVFPAIPYCIDLLGGPYITGSEKAPLVFRPARPR
ncbi:MAG: molybdopterin adenylyltransferase [Pseudomonadota bacterium]|jgi:molybdopterin adenylyltransferase